MIRPLEERDYGAVIDIVNDCWRTVYAGIVNPDLLGEGGCIERAARLRSDFDSCRLEEYVWEQDGRARALLSFGKTADADKADAFEIWRIYLAPELRGRGVGGKLLAFAEKCAVDRAYRESLIWAFSENHRAVTFYQNHGYKVDRTEALGAPYFACGTRLSKKTIK